MTERTFAFVFFLLFFSLLPEIVFCQENYTISGYVSDGQSGENLINANVYIKELTSGTTTNSSGFYSFQIEAGDYTLVASFTGYERFEQKLEFGENRKLRINVSLNPHTLDEVEITADRDRNTNSVQMGEINLEVQEIKKIPAFLGEVDVLKTIQLLPGVQSAGEGNTGFYVRGGGPDQNLILLDGVPIREMGIEQLRATAFDGLVRLVKRGRSAGVLRDDFTTQDVVLVLMANAGLVERAHGIAHDASSRLVHVLLDGFRAEAATPGPSAPSPRRTQLAMRRNAEHRLGTKRTRPTRSEGQQR